MLMTLLPIVTFCQACAVLKDPFLNVGNAVGNIHGCQAGAIIECIDPNAINTAGNNHIFQPIAFVECTIPNDGNVIADGYGDQIVTIQECVVPNADYGQVIDCAGNGNIAIQTCITGDCYLGSIGGIGVIAVLFGLGLDWRQKRKSHETK